ncbi:MAG: carboxypeptidase-like regulatory domain-containing protein [Maribacter sp.]|uniref:carboxypeptidase-like regulatory domain-containing protein n=1 Tax=Maribacter sp. TaxID=1897614 RepID=UPI0032998696
MKNVSRISVIAVCLFLASIANVKAQEVVNLSSIVQPESNEIQKTERTKVILETYTVKGMVRDQDNLPLGGVNVVLKGTKEGVVTDLDGKFEFPKALEVDDILIFSYIGYKPKEYKVQKSESKSIEITITFQASDISLMGAVEVEGVYSSKRSIFQKLIGIFN